MWAQEDGKEPKLAAPRIVSNPVDEGSRLANKSAVHNLPYMNRNPAV